MNLTNNQGKLITFLAIAAGGYFIYKHFFEREATFIQNSKDEIYSLSGENKKNGLKPTAAHIAIANQIFDNFNHAIVTNANEDRIIQLFQGSGNNKRSVSDMRSIYEAYGVRRLPNRVDFDIFGIGFSSGSLIQHVERIFDQSRNSAKQFLQVLNSVLSFD